MTTHPHRSITTRPHRRGGYIWIAPGLTATEGYDGLPTLTIRRGGKIIKQCRGSSLGFAVPLTRGDARYLLALAGEGCAPKRTL